MAEEFKAIETQEQLNAIIGERLKRSEKQYTEEKAGMQKQIDELKATNEALNKTLTESNDKYKGYDDTLSELQGKVAKYESASLKQKIAHEMGIPYEMADRLRGDNEEELKKDAEALKTFMPKAQAPQKSTSLAGSNSDSSESALRRMLADMNIN